MTILNTSGERPVRGGWGWSPPKNAGEGGGGGGEPLGPPWEGRPEGRQDPDPEQKMCMSYPCNRVQVKQMFTRRLRALAAACMRTCRVLVGAARRTCYSKTAIKAYQNRPKRMSEKSRRSPRSPPGRSPSSPSVVMGGWRDFCKNKFGGYLSKYFRGVVRGSGVPRVTSGGGLGGC